MKAVITLAMLLTLFISGCGHKEGVRSEAQKSYIYFSGETRGVLVSIDKGEEFSVKSGETNQYEVRPGKRLVEVSCDGRLIIKREIYLGDGVSKEIEVR